MEGNNANTIGNVNAEDVQKQKESLKQPFDVFVKQKWLPGLGSNQQPRS